MKSILHYLLLIAAITGCATRDDSLTNILSGYYKITMITSDVSADLNNDGIASEDLFDEIAGYHYTSDGQGYIFYDFNSWVNYMEVRPLKGSNNDAKLIAINFPDQVMDPDSNPKFLMFYKKSFTHYTYELNGNKNITLIDPNPGFKENGKPVSIERLPRGDLQLTVEKSVYDFRTQTWVPVNLTALYVRVGEN